MKNELLFLKGASECEYKKPGFKVWETGFPEADGHTVRIAFDTRYPPEEDTKARNRVASMTIVVVSGEVACFFLEGAGSARVFRAGDIVHVPRMCYYIWYPFGHVAFVNTSVPKWEEQDRDIHQLTGEDIALLKKLGAELVL
jgi:hypothetical protein